MSAHGRLIALSSGRLASDAQSTRRKHASHHACRASPSSPGCSPPSRLAAAGSSAASLPQGSEHGHARPGRLHDRDRQPLLADGAGQPLGLPRDGRLGRASSGSTSTSRTRRRRSSGIEARRRPRHRHRGRRARRGHVRLVRAGRRRQRLVPRRGHEGVRERQGRHDGRLVGGRRRRGPAGDRRARQPGARNVLPRGVLHGTGGGRARACSAVDEQRRGSVRLYEQRSSDQELHSARAGGREHKFYAHGVGPVLEITASRAAPAATELVSRS